MQRRHTLRGLFLMILAPALSAWRDETGRKGEGDGVRTVAGVGELVVVFPDTEPISPAERTATRGVCSASLEAGGFGGEGIPHPRGGDASPGAGSGDGGADVTPERE